MMGKQGREREDESGSCCSPDLYTGSTVSAGAPDRSASSCLRKLSTSDDVDESNWLTVPLYTLVDVVRSLPTGGDAVPIFVSTVDFLLVHEFAAACGTMIDAAEVDGTAESWLLDSLVGTVGDKMVWSSSAKKRSTSSLDML